MHTVLLVLLSISIHHALSDHDATSSATSTSTKDEPEPGPAPGGPPGGSPPPRPGGGGGAYNYPPPPAEGGGFPGGFGGGFPGIFPGFGFSKNFDFNAGAGFGPFGGGFGGIPGGLGGIGGLPGGLGGLLAGGLSPGDIGDEFGGIPPDAGLGGFGGGGFGGFGPSYVPSTWIGSALGAKGDLLFPVVIFVFFVVGVWTVIQLLLGFIVPLIASKLAIKSGLKGGGLGLFRRDAPALEGISPVVSPDLDFITNSVLDAINEPKCLKYVACHSGKFLNSMAGGGDQKNSSYEGILKTLSSMTRSDALNTFEEAFINGSKDCSEFTCEKSGDSHAQQVLQQTSTNSTDDSTKTNEIH